MGLLFRRWLDVPVFILSNILIDMEVLADHYVQPGWPVHQLWHFHTLLIGGLAGAVFGAIVYTIKPFRWCSETSMKLIGLSAKPTLLSMVLAGLLGAWLHVFIDSFFHYDVQIFWPHAKNTIGMWTRSHAGISYNDMQSTVRFWCRVFWILMAGLYILILMWKLKSKNQDKPHL